MERRYFPVTPVAPVTPVGNRAQRRNAERQSRRVQTRAIKPKKAYNTVEYVTLRATCLTKKERLDMMVPAREGFKALREGVATYLQWAAVVTAVGRAMAIEAQGVVRGAHEHFAAADCALDAVWHRVQDGVKGAAWGRCTTLYFDEIAALREALNLHDFQLQKLAVSELRKAIDQAQLNVRAAGGVEIHAPTDSTPLPIQEILL